MLLIKKGREPDSLSRYRKTAYATYDGCNKTDIRKNLLADRWRAAIVNSTPLIALSKAERLDLLRNMESKIFEITRLGGQQAPEPRSAKSNYRKGAAVDQKNQKMRRKHIWQQRLPDK